MSKIVKAAIYNEFPDFQADKLPAEEKYITLVVKVDDRGDGWYTYKGGFDADRERLQALANEIIGQEFETGIMFHPGATYQLG